MGEFQLEILTATYYVHQHQRELPPKGEGRLNSLFTVHCVHSPSVGFGLN